MSITQFTLSQTEEATVQQLFEIAALQYPELQAVVFEEQSLTYHELNLAASHLANQILNKAEGEEIIGISTTRSLEMVIALLAILKSGKAYLPLDPAYPLQRLQQIRDDSGVKTCISLTQETTFFAQLGLQPLSSDERTPYDKITSFVQGKNGCVLYTSGSTGKPKGVCLGHRSLVNFLNWQKEHALSGAGVRSLQFCHLSFDASFQEIFVPLTTGGTVYLITDDYRLDGGRLLQFLTDHSISKAFFPYVTLQYLTEAAVAEKQFPVDLKEVTTGGELLKITPAIRQFFAAIPDSVLLNIYGPTEATVCVTTLRLSGDPQQWDAIPTIGSEMAGTRIYLLNDQMELAEQGASAELCISGVCLANGYLNQPELTAEKFMTWNHPDQGPIRIYRTGDQGRYLDNGEIEFGGRIDSQVKIRGNRVEPGEIEVILLQQKYIEQAVVILREDQPGRKNLVAYVVGNKAQFNALLLRDAIRDSLPDYMIPSNFVHLESLPKTVSGKVDKSALPKPDAKRPDLNVLYRKAGTPLEQELCHLIADLLLYDKIGIDDNFFELGGNSLLAQKMVSLIKYQFNLSLPITKLYQFPTVAAMAGFLDKSNQKARETVKKQDRTAGSDAIAIISMAGRFPGAENISSLWKLLLEGKETTTFFKEEELDETIAPALKNDPSYVRARGIIKNADQFDPSFFGINPKLAELMDPQQRVFLEIAREALEQSGYLSSKSGSKIGVFAGTGNNTYYEYNVLGHPQLIENQGKLQVLTVNEKDYVASRTAYHLNLKGPAVSVNSACSTSLLAIAQAVGSLRSGQCDAALAGGASITAPINSGHLYQEGSMLSADGHCRPFDDDATGTVFSDGAGVVLLKRLNDAIADGDQIYGVIKGIGINNDGSGKGSFTAPSTEGQCDAIVQAIQDAGIEASAISYVETHGTGTPIGDPIEFEGLKEAFGEQAKTQFCAIGSVKSNFGHLTQAAGVTGLIKTCLALHHKKIPASLGYKRPNRNIDFANSPFYVNDKLSDWNTEEKRIAGVSSFGVGGTNVHVILEEYEQTPLPSAPSRSPELITWSAQTEKSREDYALALSHYVKENETVNLSDLGSSLRRSREDFQFRRFAVVRSEAALLSHLSNDKPVPAEVNHLKEVPQEIIFTFPGQGAQYLNMAHGLYQNEPVYKKSIDLCASILEPIIQLDIRSIIFPEVLDENADARLKDTRYTQPALFVTEYALAKLWMHWGIVPTLFCGHSIGEYVAAHLSGVFSLEDGLRLIATRGAMVSELPSGSMLSVRTEAGNLDGLLTKGLSIAAINSPKLCVVAGPDQEIEAFSALLDTKEIANKLLYTSHAFHSAMMDPIVADFKIVVAEVTLHPPGIPIISTVTGKTLTPEEAVNPDYWARHLRNTVKFADAIETILNYDQPLFLEVGPGTVTTTLVKQIAALRSVPVKAIASLYNKEDDHTAILTALGQLWNAGLTPDWEQYNGPGNRNFLSLPTYQFDRNKYWVPAVAINNTSTLLNEINPPLNNRDFNPLIMRKNNLTSKIKQVLEDASGIEMAGVESDRNFLEIGLDSLLLTQVAISLKREFNLPITFRKLNEEYATIAALVTYLDENTPPDPQETVVQQASISVPIQAANSFPINTAPANDSALGLIAQQLEILSKQVMLMQGSSPVLSPVATAPLAQKQAATPAPALDKELSLQEKAEIQKPFGATPKIERHSSDLNPKQQEFLGELTIRYNQRTAKSKAYAAESRTYMADPRVVSGFKPQTKDLIYPIVINKSSGSKMWDLDGNEYIDVLNGFGSNMLGYQPEVIKKAMHQQIENGYEVGPQHELAAEVSKLVCEFTGFDRSALCSTGSEAVLGCIRIARTVTGRSLIVAFTGSYHGIIDEVLVRGTKKLKSFPAAAGIMPEAVQNILVLDYGTDEALAIIKERADEIAAVLIEPIQSRRPEFVPVDFLKEVRAITEASGSALIFDEVITGFRMHPGGAQALFNVRADLASYGKVVGAGIPIGVIAGKKIFMDALDGGTWQYGDASFPEVGVTYFAGTFVRHPLALASAKASLDYMKEKGPGLQQSLNDKGNYIAGNLNKEIEKRNLPFFVANYGSLWKVKFNEELPYSELMFALMREKGIHILDGFPCFITEATSDADIARIISCFTESMDEMITAGFFPSPKTLNTGFNPDAIVINADNPPVKGARLGKDQEGNPAWFISDPEQEGKFLKVEINA
ncbi:type I polyketide synthase [Pedobacter caeni]|uniref:Amino acid adenylation domain-containing protein n=1 Tax=Pedobacter caeni TaxID=288992 RepID=A0A1M4WS39_9SPHI|nr:type I polyketide synthase [Pedobacter caeni]SHE84056.1 amino acid adenylation domain-containing protein [Pedobacter caeni]